MSVERWPVVAMVGGYTCIATGGVLVADNVLCCLVMANGSNGVRGSEPICGYQQ
jgi:hypothetical protein